MGLRFKRRGKWHNHSRNQRVEPLRMETPETLGELVDIVKGADDKKLKIRAVGSGHSWSDAALAPDVLVKTHRLNRELNVDCVRGGYDGTHLVRTEAGVTLKELNLRLERQGLALTNMGGWDAQTLAGALSTSTHGSGRELGPICDQVVSIDIVACEGQCIRIERRDGPTDKAQLRATCAGWRIEKKDDWFNAVLVGMGCLGVIYAVTLRVEPFYYLCETRKLETWCDVRNQLADGTLLGAGDRHVEIYVNVHRRKDRNLCLVTRRTPADGPARRFRDRHRPLSAELVGRLAPVTAKALDFVTRRFPDVTPWVVDRALKAIVDDKHINKWHKVLKLGTANLMPAYAMEIAIELDEGNRYLKAIDKVLEVAEHRRQLGKVYSTAPISLRFVKASPAFMSMMHGRDTLMIELIQLSGTEGGVELLATYEEELYAFEGRPHWGMHNSLTGSHDLVRSMYPRYEDWMRVHDELNRTGVFNSPFSKRMGFSKSIYGPRSASYSPGNSRR
jgi:L-gulono-1,4-lactone dehydrogenase